MHKISSFILVVLLTANMSCKKHEDYNTDKADLSLYKQLYGATNVSQDGDFVIIKSAGLPNHQSPYYKGSEWASTLYGPYNGTNPNWASNGDTIKSFSYIFRIPLYPAEASKKVFTPDEKPMGIAINGVPFFNQFEGVNHSLFYSINSFDQFGGHPNALGQYHYHIEPNYITAKLGKSILLGFLLDGFPVYGPIENNTSVMNESLDVWHGHAHATAEYPGGIYHYHITDSLPYINGNGFYGTPGTVNF